MPPAGACNIRSRGLAATSRHSTTLTALDLLTQALEKVDGQQAWRVRHLLSLALCQGSEDGKPEDMPKTLAKALELATAANLQPLRVSRAAGVCSSPWRALSQAGGNGHAGHITDFAVSGTVSWRCILLQAEVLALQTHHQTQQAAKAAAAKPGGPAGSGGKGPGVPAAPPAPKQAAPPGKRKPGEPAAVGAGKGKLQLALLLGCTQHPCPSLGCQHVLGTLDSCSPLQLMWMERWRCCSGCCQPSQMPRQPSSSCRQH